MPKTAVDYSKNVIYKIVCNDLTITELYVGSTTDFTRRKNQHKNTCINQNDKKTNLKIYQTIRNHGNWENWTMVQIEEYPCTNGNEARSRERYWFEQLNATLNTIRPLITHDEWKQWSKNYEILNKDVRKEKKLKNREKNKDKISEQTKKYRELNKDIINAPYTCECGSVFVVCKKSRHFKSKKHINYLNLQKENI